jgi:SAM-dependent MidA family methyltransferase
MTPLAELLLRRIKTEGPLPFDTFMGECLYHPEFGYYASGKARIGKEGDFFTAVSVGPVLGKLLAYQFAEMWRFLGRPRPWHITEQGAFEGVLARDILEQLRRLDRECFEATELFLIEPFASLEEKQKTTLEEFRSRIRWFRSLEECPPFEGVHYSNELPDAFPVRVLRRMAEGWAELGVGWTDSGFTWVERAGPSELVSRESAHLSPAPEGFLREVCPGYAAWIGLLSKRLRKGWVLVLDYGLTEAELALPHRHQGTLTSYRNHQRTDSVFLNPGEQDITHQVNFSALCRGARECGWEVASYATQAQFLTPLGMLHWEGMTSAPDLETSRELRAFQTLIHPEAMGHRFKSLLLRTHCCAGHRVAGARFGVRNV